MNAPKTLADLKRQLPEQFATGVPNGWLLGWSECRLQSELTAAVCPLKIQNCTSFDYAFCNHFEVPIDCEGARNVYVLTIRISFVCDLFSFHWTRDNRSRHKGGGTVRTPETAEALPLERKIRQLLEQHGFSEIPQEWMDEVVPGVRLELAGTRNVTVSKCLFEDYDG